jgi:hypothetical protein
LKDIPLLDCVASKHPRRDHSFNISNRFPRSVMTVSQSIFVHFLPLATWIANITAVSIDQGQITITDWGDTLIITGLVISMTVNALVTGLIVFRIFKVFREVKAASASDKVLLNVTGGSKLRSIIFIIIESGMALLSIQLTGIVITIFISVDSFEVIGVIHQMFNVIIRSIMCFASHLTDNVNLG